MRTEVLVRRADEDVDVPSAHVDRAVRPVVDRVRPGERAGGVGELDDAADVRGRADRVGGERERDDPRAIRELALEVVVVDLEIVGESRDADGDVQVVRDLEPGRDVGVVVEGRVDDLVAGAQRPCERAAEQEVERGHALPERGLVGRAAEETTRGFVGEVDELDRPDARLVGRPDVRVVLAEVARDRVDDLVGALGPARAVEEREAAVERGEAHGAPMLALSSRR